MKKIKEKNIQEYIPIQKITKEGIIKLKNNKYIKIIKVNPINYNLKSDLEKKSILNSYKIFLKTCNFNVQILIQSKKENLENHINKIRKNIQKEKNNYLKEISESYIKYIEKLNTSKKSSTKNFYIIIENNKINKKEINESEEIMKNELKEKYFKIKECLARCGNTVTEIIDEKEIIQIIYSFLNTRKNLYN